MHFWALLFLHYNLRGTVDGFTFVAAGSFNQVVLYFFESTFVCAVDLFILISGYFLSGTQKRNLVKPFELIVQTILFALSVYLIRLLLVKQASVSLVFSSNLSFRIIL